ncbi:small serum protein 5-like [Anolis carolinensis]|uniref:small serum protein 5-like n=1 Tax=Anolis carolinensis TaxID=28377 RepID=UPI002F2B41D3
MKLLLILAVSSFSLALCHAACFVAPIETEGKEGKPNVCTDVYDAKTYPIGSQWNTAHCKECWCSDNGMVCCDRFGGIAVMEGCISVVDPETCKYKFYKEDDPSTLCTV